MVSFRSLGLFSATALFSCLLSPRARADEATLPDNIGHHLRQMVDWYQTEAASRPASERRAMLAKRLPAQNRHAQLDGTASRVVVDVRLDGTQPLAAVQASLEALGLEVFAQHDIGGMGSVLSARLPLAQTVEAAKLPGVQSITLVRRPHHHVGKVTSQGVGVIHSDQVNAMKYTGAGITVGVLSDSYNLVTPSAPADVLSGDLPGVGNPQGYTKPVFVLAEGATGEGNTDEGRAMLQIVHDVAPGAALAFSTTGDSPESFASNIRAMRTNPGANCDVLVDDVTFDEEPFFSDGVIAQAINDVVTSTTLPGKPVLYYTAAGNSSNGLYIGDFDPVDDSEARAGLGNNNIQLDQVPEVLTAGGFHNFKGKAGKTPVIVQHFTVKGIGQPVTDGSDIVEVDFQWDDPFIAGQITTDYNLLVFDSNGNYLADLSGIDNNFRTGMPSEYADLGQSPDGSDGVYQLVISRTAPQGTATHLRTIAYTETSLYVSDKFTTPSTPSVYGHQAPPGGDAVAAYDYTNLSEPEDYSSIGPMTLYFDVNGNRLATPEVRFQPTIAAPDGVDTTFFPTGDGQDSDNDGFPNFFGTSAAAPHAAGVAALLLQAGGGPNSLTADHVRELLESTTYPHDLDPSFSSAVVATSDGLSTATLTANGDSSDNSAFSPQFFQLSFTGPPTRYIKKVVIDLSAANLEFDSTVATGFPFTVYAKGTALTTSDFVANFSGPEGHQNVLTLKFYPGVFIPGETLSFGVDRDDTSTDANGNSADEVANATVSLITLDGGVKQKGNGVFVNSIGTGNTTVDGYGLINAEAAVQKLLSGQ